MTKDNLLRACDHTRKQSLKKANTGGHKNLIGMQIGSLWNILKSSGQQRKLRQILALLKHQLFFGSESTTFLVAMSPKQEPLKNGSLQAEIRTPCSEEKARKVRDGKADVLRKDSLFIPLRNGLQSFQKCENVIISAVKCAASLVEDYIFTISNHFQIRKSEPILTTLFSSVKNATTLFTVKRMSRGYF